MTKHFGFRATKDRHGQTGWHVRLPHQCSSWDIAGDEFDRIDHQQAIGNLESFLAEGAQALAALKAGKEFPGEPT